MLSLELSELDYQFLYIQFMGNNVEDKAIPRTRYFAYVLGENARLTAEIEMIGYQLVIISYKTMCEK